MTQRNTQKSTNEADLNLNLVTSKPENGRDRGLSKKVTKCKIAQRINVEAFLCINEETNSSCDLKRRLHGLNNVWYTVSVIFAKKK